MTTRAAIYIRQSQTHEDTISPQLQKEAATKFALSQGWQVAEGDYSDIDISGRKMDNRPGLRRLRADYDLGKFDIAVAYDFSRFSRTLEDGASIIANMKVATYKEGIPQEDDDFVPLLHLLLAHRFSREMGKRWKEAHRYRAQRGLPPTGQPYFGYDKTKDGYKPNEYAPLLKKAYQDYVNGKSFKTITCEWNNAGVPTMTDRATEWSYPTVIGLMMKKFQLGIIEFNGEEFPGKHEAIVSEDLYAAFIARRNQNRKLAPRHKYPEWPLSGTMVCGSCGGAVGQIQRFRDGATRLGCLNRRNKGNCEQRAIYRRQAEWALTLFLSQYQDAILSALPDAETQSKLSADVDEAQYAVTHAKSRLQAFLESITDLGLTVSESKDILTSRRADVEAAEKALQEAQAELALSMPQDEAIEVLERKEDLSPSEWALFLRSNLIEKCILEPDQSFTIIGKNGDKINQAKMSFNGQTVTEKPTTQGLSREETRQARKWLRSNGHPVAVRGNIKYEFLKLWVDAGKPEV